MLIHAIISAKEDMTSDFYRGRAFSSAFADKSLMDTTAWRDRLATAIKLSGKSKRAISLATGNGAGYIHSLLSEGKTPTIENLIKVCNEIDVSLAYVLYGFDITREDAELLSAMKESPEMRSAVLTLVRRQPSSEPDE